MKAGSVHRRAFTLVEVLVVCVILAVLVGMTIPIISQGVMMANRAKCASNMRQIGVALILYAGEHDGYLPPTTHTTGSLGKLGRYSSWIYLIADYLGDIDQVRICPADRRDRQEAILKSDGLTSYVLNDLVFDPEEEGIQYNRLQNIPLPLQTKILFNVSDDRSISRGWDHAHCGEWTSWYGMLADVEVDRHRVGERATDRLSGSANYLYADGHVETISAQEMKQIVASGINPGAVPTLSPNQP